MATEDPLNGQRCPLDFHVSLSGQESLALCLDSHDTLHPVYRPSLRQISSAARLDQNRSIFLHIALVTFTLPDQEVAHIALDHHCRVQSGLLAPTVVLLSPDALDRLGRLVG